MKNILKYAALSMLWASAVMAGPTDESILYNKSGKSLYLVVVKTANYKKDDRTVYKEPEKSEAVVKVYGYDVSDLIELKDNQALKVKNFPMPPTSSFGVTKYNRSLWVALSPYSAELNRALKNGQLTSKDYAFRLGSAKAGVFLPKGNGIKFDTSDSAVKKASKDRAMELVDGVVENEVTIYY